MSGRGSVLCVVGAFIGAIAFASLTSPAWAQSSRSDPPTQAIAAARHDDLQRRFGHALVDEGRDLALDPAAGPDAARQMLLRRAAVYEDVQDYTRAEAEFARALQISPPVAAVYAARGYFYLRRGRFPDALADFLAGMNLEPDNPRLHYGAGRVETALRDYAGAVTFYDEAIKLSPRDPTLYLARAEARMHLDQPAGARADYDRAIAISLPRATDQYYAFLGRGYAFLLQSDYARAIADFGRAIDIDPGSLDARMWRGYAREKTGQVALALDDYERAVEIAPNDRMARNSLQRLRSN